MRKIISFMFCFSFIASLIAITVSAQEKTAYIFRNVEVNSASDLRIISDLREFFNVNVVEFDDTDAAGYEMPFDLSGADMMYSSESVSSGNIANMLYHEFDAVPQITGEQALLDDLSFSGGGNGSTNGTSVVIVDNEHPITQGFPLGEITILNTPMEMGHLDNPPEGVRILATAPGNPNRARLWVVEEGTVINSREALDIRIGTWLQGRDVYISMNDQGRQLIFNVFAYALDVEAPQLIVPAPINLTVNRSISQNAITPQGSAQVEIAVNIETGQSGNLMIIETPPASVNITNPQASAGTATVLADGRVEWNIPNASGSPRLTYTVNPRGGAGVYSFAGELVINGGHTIVIEGDTLIGVIGTPSNKTVYFFRNIEVNSLSDQKMILDLKAHFGVQVEEFDDTNAAGYEMPGDLIDADMMFSSESITSGNIAGMLYHELDGTPQITGEQALLDDLSYSGGGNGSSVANTLEIVDNQHPITSGFELGTVQVTTGSYEMGHLDNPPAWVRVLATAPDNPTRARLWIIEKDEIANGFPVPGIRIGTWIQGRDSYANLTAEGQRLFFQLFAYALDVQPPAHVADFMLH